MDGGLFLLKLASSAQTLQPISKPAIHRRQYSRGLNQTCARRSLHYDRDGLVQPFALKRACRSRRCNCKTAANGKPAPRRLHPIRAGQECSLKSGGCALPSRLPPLTGLDPAGQPEPFRMSVLERMYTSISHYSPMCNSWEWLVPASSRQR